METIRNAKILVVGDTGYIGGYAAAYFCEAGNEVVGISRGAANVKPSWTHFPCDASNKDDLAKVLTGHKFDFVFSFVGCVDHRNIANGGGEVLRHHFVSNLNLIELTFSPILKRFFAMGSADEYEDKNGPIRESDPVSAFSPYSAAKLSISHLIPALWKSDKFPGTVGRLFLAYGPRQPTNRVIPFIIAKCLKGEVVDLSPGDQIRDYCYIDDVMSFLNACAVQPDSSGQIFNIGSGVPTKVKELAVLIQRTVESGTLNFGGVPYRTGEKMSAYSDISKAKALLGWAPQVNLEEGLSRTLNYFKTKQ